MNPHNEINNLDKLIDSLQNSLQYSRNKPKDTKNLNTIISARNSFDNMLNNKYHTEIVEILIYDKLLDMYRSSNIASGGDINACEASLMFLYDNILSMGKNARKELVIEELKLYLDFYEYKDGLESRSIEDQKRYIFERDTQIKTKLSERMRKIKGMIKYSLK